MIIIVTAGDVLDRGVWDEFCEMFGINEWALNEGRMDRNDQFRLSEQQATELGFLRKQYV